MVYEYFFYPLYKNASYWLVFEMTRFKLDKTGTAAFLFKLPYVGLYSVYDCNIYFLRLPRLAFQVNEYFCIYFVFMFVTILKLSVWYNVGQVRWMMVPSVASTSLQSSINVLLNYMSGVGASRISDMWPSTLTADMLVYRRSFSFVWIVRAVASWPIWKLLFRRGKWWKTSGRIAGSWKRFELRIWSEYYTVAFGFIWTRIHCFCERERLNMSVVFWVVTPCNLKGGVTSENLKSQWLKIFENKTMNTNCDPKNYEPN
jgi:hypothetical protein